MEYLMFVLGTVLGSFLNVVGLRLVEGGSIGGRSCCPSCKKQLKCYNLVPLISYVAQRGKCTNCKTHISLQYPIVELMTGVAFTLTYITIGLDYALIALCIFACTLTVSTSTDIKDKSAHDFVSVIGLISVLFGIYLCNGFSRERLVISVIMLLLFSMLAFLKLSGAGDILVIFSMSLVLGIDIMYAITAASISALLFYTIKREKEIPFVPFLYIGYMTALLINIVRN